MSDKRRETLEDKIINGIDSELLTGRTDEIDEEEEHHYSDKGGEEYEEEEDEDEKTEEEKLIDTCVKECVTMHDISGRPISKVAGETAIEYGVRYRTEEIKERARKIVENR